MLTKRDWFMAEDGKRSKKYYEVLAAVDKEDRIRLSRHGRKSRHETFTL
jgi:hypothetical protein